jgi:hypothetical protein
MPTAPSTDREAVPMETWIARGAQAIQRGEQRGVERDEDLSCGG